jgi:NhaP-type Na+/H+ or K+/H+ antiporter
VVGHHRGIHWLAFAGAAVLLLLLSRNRRQEIRSVIGVCLLGLTLEYVQHLIYRNIMEWWDVRDDALAVLAAFMLYRLAGTCGAAFAVTPSAAVPETVGPTEVGKS